MKRKRQSEGSAPQKKANANRQNAVAKPQKSLRFQVNTVHGPSPEKKEITNASNLIFLPTANTFVAIAATNLLNGVVQGTTAETRIGRKIRMRSLDIRWQLELQTTSVGGSPCRVLVVYDKQANAALPTVVQILNTNDFNSPMLLANSDRFTVLRSFITEPVSVSNNFSVAGHEFIPMDLETIYNDTNAGTIADIQTGSIFLLVAQTGQVTTAGPLFQYISRIRFDDN